MTETNPEGEPVRSARWHESLERLISNNFWKLVALGLVGVAAVLYFDVQLPTEPPRWMVTAFWTAALGSPIAYVLASKTVDLLYDPFGVVLLDLDARETDVAIYNIPRKRWKEVTVLEGDLNRLDATQTVYSGKDFDPEELTVRGTWRGSLSDFELVREQAKIKQLRGRLETEAKRGFAIESQAWMIVRQATTQAVKSIVRTFERGTMPTQDGLEVNDAVEDAIDSFDFELADRDTSTQSGTVEAEDLIEEEADAAESEVSADD